MLFVRYRALRRGGIVQQTQLNPPDVVGYGGQWGNYTDVEANLVLMTYRFYSPVYCRFLTRDPKGYEGGINLYAYCRNNPINRFDPLGLDTAMQILNSEATQEWVYNVNNVLNTNPQLAQQTAATTAFTASATYSYLGGASTLGPIGVAAVGIPVLAYGAYNGIGVPLANALFPMDMSSQIDPRTAQINALSNCFVVGTPIPMTADSYKPIEQVTVGDTVLSRDAQTGTTEAKKVVQTFVHDTEQTLLLSFANGEQVETTPGHPFFVEGKGFVLAGRLALGNAIVTRAGPATRLVSIQNKTGRVRVYNFEVEGFHTYFVGSNNGGLWVHNQSFRVHTVAPDWAVKGAHITYHGVELSVRPGEGGSIVFKPVFSNGGQAAVTAASDARHLLGNRDFMTRLLRQVSSAVPYVLQFPNEGGAGRSGELRFLEKAIRKKLQ
jgi:RHS repeat-associated protein